MKKLLKWIIKDLKKSGVNIGRYPVIKCQLDWDLIQMSLDGK
jgi:hypothetical protein